MPFFSFNAEERISDLGEELSTFVSYPSIWIEIEYVEEV
jgi:hypothetical protein